MSTNHGENADNYSHDARLGRILDEFLRRRSAGEPNTEEQLCAQYPELADELREMLSTARDLRPDQDRIAALIKQGVLDPSDDARYLASFGAYKITGFIGRGGMGIVLKAYEDSLNRTVALKLLRPELTEDDVALSRFEREAKSAAALNHANIVTVYIVGRQGDMPFIGMEYVEGRSLSHVICANGPLPAETTRHIFRQLLQALGAAHEEGLLHRDVKSSNILVDGGGQRSAASDQPSRVGSQRTDADPRTPNTTDPSPPLLPSIKLADFGLARMRNAQTRLTLGDSVLGTPEYMSPEQARGDEEIDHRADLYSAGVVLYEMLTGRTPFRADAPTAAIHQILHVDPPEPRTFNKNVDPGLASLALRLIAKEPEDRFALAAEVIDALDAAERVLSLEKRRRLRRRLVLGMPAAAILMGCTWLWSRFSNGSAEDIPTSHPTRRIVDVWVGDPDRTNIWIKRADGTEALFHEFPAAVDCVKDVAVLDKDGAGDQLVVAGLNRPLTGNNLIAFDAQGNEDWARDISNIAPGYQWPDCGSSSHWSCYMIRIGDLDGWAGDALVVVARDTDSYPARISRIDPRSGRVSSTFWHMGHFEDVQIVPDFLEPNRPAVIAWGINNKLDGFGEPYPPPDYEPLPGEDRPATRYDQVSVVMVLDLDNMDGAGPPRTPRLDAERFGTARPIAYALLNSPRDTPTGSYIPEGRTERCYPEPRQRGSVTSIEVQPRAGKAGAAPWIRVFVDGPPKLVGGAQLDVDRNLDVRAVELVTGSPPHITREFWVGLWRPIIQNGKCVNDSRNAFHASPGD